MIGNRNNYYSSKHATKQDWKEKADKAREDMKILELVVTERVNVTSVENGLTVNVHFLKVSYND